MDDVNNIQNIIIGVQTIAIAIAGIYAIKAFRQTQKISESQREQTNRIHNEQKRLAQSQNKHQTFLSFFEHLKTMREIHPTEPNWDDVSDSANLLELIAIVWIDRLVSRKLLYVVYGRLFIRVYEQIENATDQHGVEKGKQILRRDCVTAVNLYKKLKKRIQLETVNLNPNQSEKNLLSKD